MHIQLSGVEIICVIVCTEMELVLIKWTLSIKWSQTPTLCSISSIRLFLFIKYPSLHHEPIIYSGLNENDRLKIVLRNQHSHIET